MSQDVEYYKFRVKEMSDVSEEEEDAIRKVIHKNQPKDKILDNDDLQDYVDGKEIKEYDEYEEALNERELMKNKELLRQKRRKLPVSLTTQTDPPEGKDFGIQIKDGEEVIPFVDIRPLSGKLKPQKHENLTLDDYSNFDSVPNLKRWNSIKNTISYNTDDLAEFYGRMSEDLKVGVKMANQTIYHKIVLTKLLTETDLYKIKTIDIKLYK